MRRISVARSTPPPARAQARWTDADDERLRDQYGLVADATLARRLGRTVGALAQRAYTLGLRHTTNFYTCTTAGAALGVDAKTVRAWIAREDLTADRAPWKVGSRGRPWRIRPADLEAFVRTHPERLDFKRLPQNYLRTLLRRVVPATHVSKTCRPWTPEEDAYLINYRQRKTHAALAAFLNRSKEAVHYRLGRLRAEGRLVPYKGPWRTRTGNGTATAPRPWTAQEDAYIQANWGRKLNPDEQKAWGQRLTSADIAAALGRTRQAVESRASRLGCKNPGWATGPWTAAEDAYLRAHWVSRPGARGGWTRIPVRAIAAALNRSTATVRRRARALGLVVARQAGPGAEEAWAA
jgi:hypothetical protein